MSPACVTSLLIGIILTTVCVGFRSTNRLQSHPSLSLNADLNAGNNEHCPTNELSRDRRERRSFFESISKASIAALTAYSAIGLRTAAYAASDIVAPANPSKGFQTKTGLKYFDFEEGKLLRQLLLNG